MSNETQLQDDMLDAVVIGAGLREFHNEVGLHVQVLEAAADVGGSWY